MPEFFKVTEIGMRPGAADGMDPELLLMLEVCKRLELASEDNLIDLCMKLERDFGSVENAIVAVKSGRVQFEVDEEASDA
jgi:hypothetical protein